VTPGSFFNRQATPNISTLTLRWPIKQGGDATMMILIQALKSMLVRPAKQGSTLEYSAFGL
jgi:hypothetical protein